jgi:hypothetical protein
MSDFCGASVLFFVMCVHDEIRQALALSECFQLTDVSCSHISKSAFAANLKGLRIDHTRFSVEGCASLLSSCQQLVKQN